jgi:ATP-dependent helicase/nuclease subunit A
MCEEIIDKEERMKIARELDRTILVEAGAGSGKTRSLVDRMLALLRSGIVTIDNMAAVTFTRKAAAELRGRFQTSLEQSLRKETADTAVSRLQQALSNLEQCYIGTIHSFCAKILRERPVETNLDPEFTELDDIDNLVFQDACWHEYLIKIRMEDNPILNKLDDVGLLPEDLKSTFDDLANYPEVIPVGGSSAPPDFSQIGKELDAFLDRMNNRLPSKQPEKGYDKLQKEVLRVVMRKRGIGHSNPVILMKSLELLEKNLKVTKNRWPEKEGAESAFLDWEKFKEKTIDPAMRYWREYRHSFVLDFLRPALRFTNQMRHQKSRVNYQDSLLMAARLLKQFPRIRKFFQQKYTHILVDEFQDTDPVQAQMLFYLTGEDISARDWREITPKPGSLFLVGDPKQSIYRFRRADIEIYNLVKERIEKCGEVLELTTNFRSLCKLRDWNNKIFRDVFPNESNKFQAKFAPMNTVRKDSPGAFSGVYKISITKAERDKKKIIAKEDADKIADWIYWACRGNIKLTRSPEEEKRGRGADAKPGDFLILLRYKENISLYAAELEKRNIPFEISGGGAFETTPELNELVILSRALMDPHETVSTVAALRGVFFGCSDRDLLDFKQAGGDFRDWKSVSICEDGPVKRALSTLARWREWFLQSKPSAALEKICAESGLTAYLAASELGSSRAGNVYKLIEIIRNREQGDGLTFVQAVDFLEELVHLREIEEMSLMPGRKDAVRIMNMHKAKGLEAPVVFLAHPLGKNPFPVERRIVRKDREKPKGYFLAVKKGQFYQNRIISQPADWEAHADEERFYQKAEEDRLIYVASTRAKNALIISTYAEDKGEKMSWTKLNKHLEEVPELPRPHSGSDKKRPRLTVRSREFQDWQDRKELERIAAGAPRYHLETVTSLAKMEGEAPPRESGDTGMSWGRVIHYVLETLGRKEISDRELLYRTALEMEDRDLDEMERLSRLVEGIERSDLWTRAGRAKQRYFEMPFSVYTTGDELGRDIDGPFLLFGTIDLIFKEADGWIIADYKTDEIYGALARYVKFYAPQIQLYRRFWEKASREKVKESGLYFTSVNRWVIIEE